ncbi:2-phospho-L-lactate guanylyltransferase [Jatrophihabitans fulvus]
MRWTVVIPAKSLPAAKSRLLGATDGPEAHARLVRAIRSDTIAAARAARGVARVLLVTDRGEPAPDVIVQTRPGLNEALREAAEHAVQRWPDDGVAALLGDLPALRPDDLADALDAAARIASGYVADAQGTGTTLLTAVPGHELDPRFGAGSAARHAVVARALPAAPGLRLDVDEPGDLERAVSDLGVGPATAAVHSLRVANRSSCVGMMRE